MYKLEFLPSARQDMIEIVRYIGVQLGNPVAAAQLAEEFLAAAEELVTFPYAAPAYTPIRPLKHEYRKLLVRKYLLFYWVDEQKKVVTVARVLYARRDVGQLLR